MYLQPKLNVILVHVDLHDQQLLVYLLQVNSAGHYFIKTFQSTLSLYSLSDNCFDEYTPALGGFLQQVM